MTTVIEAEEGPRSTQCTSHNVRQNDMSVKCIQDTGQQRYFRARRSTASSSNMQFGL
jgi:hypothetical protein